VAATVPEATNSSGAIASIGGAEPAEAEAGAECAGFIFNTALDEEMIAENLGYGSVFLKHFTPLAGFLGKAVEEIQCRSVWIHRVWIWGNSHSVLTR
jgi:hypothetical protein